MKLTFQKKRKSLLFVLYGVSVPVLLAFSSHIGIIFQIPNNIEFLQNWIDYLSLPSNKDVAVQTLIGIATIIVVFFSFMQLGYSIRHIPTFYIYDYVLRDKSTIFLIWFQLSSLAVTSFFIIYDRIFNISDFLLAFLALLNVIIIMCYFFWLIKVTKLKVMVKYILNHIDLAKVIEWEKKILKASRDADVEFNKWQNNKKYQVKIAEPFLFTSEKNITIKLEAVGVITDIDFTRIQKILTPIYNKLDAVEVYPRIGQLVHYKGEPFLKLVPKERNYASPTDDEKKISEFKLQKVKDLSECIMINKDDYDLLLKPIEDILDVYIHIASHSASDLDKVVEVLSEFLRDEKWNKNKDGYTVSSYILKEFLQGFNNLSEDAIGPDQLASLIHFVYALRNQAVQRSDFLFLKELIALMSRIMWKMINRTNYYNPRLATFVLYYKEIIFSLTFQKHIESESSEKFKESWDRCYSDLVTFANRSAFEVMYTLVSNHFKRPKEEMRLYLMHNAEILINFLDSFRHWTKIGQKEIVEKQHEFARQAVLWSLFTFRAYYYRNRIPANIVTDIGFLMTNLSYRSYIYDEKDADKLINEFIFNEHHFDFIDFDRYEEPDLVTAATHTGGYPRMDDFWIVYSLWRKKIGKTFIPTSILDDEQHAYEIITGFKERISKLDHGKIIKLLLVNETELTELIDQYTNYLENILSSQSKIN